MRKLTKKEASALIANIKTDAILNSKELRPLNAFYDFYLLPSSEVLRIEISSGKAVLYFSLQQAYSEMGLQNNSIYSNQPVDDLLNIISNDMFAFNIKRYIIEMYTFLNLNNEIPELFDFSSISPVSKKLERINFYKNYSNLILGLVAFVSEVLSNESKGKIVLLFEGKRDFLVKSNSTYYNPYSKFIELYAEKKSKCYLDAIILSEYHTA